MLYFLAGFSSSANVALEANVDTTVVADGAPVGRGGGGGVRSQFLAFGEADSHYPVL